MLYLGEKDRGVRAATEDGAVPRKRNTKGGAVVNELDGLVEGEGPEGRGANSPLGEPHARGTRGFVKAMVVGHIAVAKIIVVPADHPRVSPDKAETIPNMIRCDGVESAPDIQESGKAVKAGIDMPFYVFRERRGCCFRGFVTSEAMLLGVNGGETNTLLHMPGA